MSALPGAGRVVTLLSDFGTAEGYAGAMKGVIVARAPGAAIHDVAHDLVPGDVLGAARTLARYAFLFPVGTIHVVVVDPGVGTDRRGLALELDGRVVVAPDNGIVTEVLRERAGFRAVELRHVTAPGSRSRTFDGRDLFAPAAGLLATGASLGDLGPPLDDPVLLSAPEPEGPGPGARGEVVTVDRFGNLVTNLPGPWLEGANGVVVAGRDIVVHHAYGDVPPGALVALVNSDGVVEIAVRDGSAARLLGSEPGDPVTLA